MTEQITDFRGDNFFLSNFYPIPGGIYVKMDDQIPSNSILHFATTEAAYQASKTSESNLQKWIAGMSPADAKKHGRFLPIREDWEDVKVRIMYNIVWAKFNNPELRLKLLATMDAELIEGNTWGDKFWGAVGYYKRIGTYESEWTWEGQNMLGKILMETRTALRPIG